MTLKDLEGKLIEYVLYFGNTMGHTEAVGRVRIMDSGKAWVGSICVPANIKVKFDDISMKFCSKISAIEMEVGRS